ncbi:MAG: hypothetical protein GWN00_13125, partial [Aliifodinibius sp.]|nr:hypothetical protein [Candidatus Saccharibacteria bacterium]NIT57132.1 hypothetical protein [Fodinibius sp.]NIV12085.1 hypothetical protein [Fodinibius sp.]NIY25714.1 hypothetical protein [Fodinibius sp.]
MSEQIRNPKEIEKEAKAVYQAEDYLEAAELFTAAANSYLAQENAIAAAEMQNNACVALI